MSTSPFLNVKFTPDFLRMAIVSIPTAEISRNKLFPASSVTAFASLMWGESVVSVVVVGMLMFSHIFRRSCCCSTTRATSCWLEHVNFSINVSRADVFSTKRATSTGNNIVDMSCMSKCRQCLCRLLPRTPGESNIDIGGIV